MFRGLNTKSRLFLLGIIQFSKHATCTSTFDVKCYANYRVHEDVINFFESVVRAFSMFPTFDMLAA